MHRDSPDTMAGLSTAASTAKSARERSGSGASPRTKPSALDSATSGIREKPKLQRFWEVFLGDLIASRLFGVARGDRVYHPAVSSIRSDADAPVGHARTAADSSAGRRISVPSESVAPRIARYSILRKLGEGGMGVVYVAYDEQLDRRVALKLIKGNEDPTQRARMLREGQAMARLSHPNVVPVFEVGEHDDALFLAMEFVEGRTLRQWQADESRTWEETLAIFVQAARGLDAAHEGGLLHRDFKPDNALVGTDGRLRVLDFGLARAMGTEPERAADEAKSGGFSETLTATGAALGTPAYMAPEQFLGQEVDARADVFAWSVALFEALYRKRPYGGRTRVELLQAVTSGDHVAPVSGRGVPAWLERAVLQGINPDKAERPQSMRALLDVVDIDPARGRKRVRLALGVAGVAGVAAAAGFLGGGADAPCEGFEERRHGVWDDAIRAEARAAFEASGFPSQHSAWLAVDSALDEHTDGLVSQMQASCEATRVRGEQSEAFLDKRTACLDERLRAVAGLTSVLREADAATVGHAEAAVASLPEAEICANASFLEAGFAPPEDEKQARAVAGVRDELAAAGALLLTGHPLDANSTITALAKRVEAIAYPPLTAETKLTLGRAATALGSYAEARSRLLEAADIAEGARHDFVAAQAWIDLLYVANEGVRDGAAAQAWSRRADAALARIGEPPRLSATLAARQADLAIEQGDFERARERLDVVEASQVDGGERDSHAVSRGRLALAAGDPSKAIEHFEEALKAATAHDERQPAVARAEQNLGGALLAMGRVDEAAAHAQRAVELWTELFGEAHPERGRSLIVLGASALGNGDLAAASKAMTGAVAAIEQSVGPDHPAAAEALIALGVVSFMEGDLESSERKTRRALELLDRAYAEDRPEIGNAAANLGETLLYLGRLEPAREQLSRASQVMQDTLGPEHPDRALPLKLLGLVHLLEGHPELAIAPLRKSVALVSEGRPYERADAIAALAIALWPSDPQAAMVVADRKGGRLTDATGRARRNALIELLPKYTSEFQQLKLEGID